MAVDKLVDSTQLDADLTSVANAIRTKGGTSASLAFPAGFVSAVEAIQTGGGGKAVSGEITIPSTITGPSAGNNMLFPGLQLPFQPDYLEIWIDKDSFEAISAPSNNRLYRIVAFRIPGSFPPFRVSNSTTYNSEAESAGNDYFFLIATSVAACSEVSNGYAISSWGYGFNEATYVQWAVKADGTLQMGRFSSAAWYIPAGKYHYVAYKGA